jgi:hypothetical protein
VKLREEKEGMMERKKKNERLVAHTTIFFNIPH